MTRNTEQTLKGESTDPHSSTVYGACALCSALSRVARHFCSLCSINNVSASRFVAHVKILSGCVKILLFIVLGLDILIYEALVYLMPLHHNSFSSLDEIISIITVGLYVLTL